MEKTEKLDKENEKILVGIGKGDRIDEVKIGYHLKL